ncbi:MAG: acetate--CoA ligase family protein [Veillonellaceae bacterium]|nr:acetate--CoA ligase family protein [Veillonellaceae bacterium]
MTSSLAPFFSAAGVAVIGASANPRKLSHGILRNLVTSKYAGSIYPVNPGENEILGKKCYASISDVPDPVELAVIVVPVAATPATLEACGKRGIRAAVIISGGFKEVGQNGADLEQECLRIAKSYQMRLIGPNCVGTMDLATGLNTTFIHGMPDEGGIGFVSQSGAVCGGVVDFLYGKKVGFSHFISLGNEADVTETDMIEYLGQEPRVRVIAAYVEQIRDGRRFLEVARKVSRSKPIVLLKGGRSDAGARAVSSHTGSLAGSHAAYQAAFKQAGVIEVDSFAELFDVAVAFDFQPLPRGTNAVLLTNAGGPAALTSDSLSFNGFRLEDLEEDTRAALRGFLNPSAQVGNPVDMLGAAEPQDYARVIETLKQDKTVDIIIPILVPQALVDPRAVAQAVVDASKGAGKPVLTCIMGDMSVDEPRLILHANRMPMYTVPEAMGAVLKGMKTYADWMAKPPVTPIVLKNIDRNAAEKLLNVSELPAELGEAQTRPLLQAYGIPLVKGGEAHTPQEAAKLAASIGFPAAMKIISPQLLHKSDAGGIVLNLKSESEVTEAYEKLFKDIAAKRPDADLQGVLIEQMAPRGQEVIIGLKRDPGFGSVVMFGLGGIYVELFKDVSFRVAPVSAAEAVEMIDETHAGKLLKGMRGAQPADLEAVVEVIMRLGQLGLDFPAILEAEVNPLLVFPVGKGALALDGRVILKQS